MVRETSLQQTGGPRPVTSERPERARPLRARFATAFEEGVIRSNPAAGVRIAHHVDQEHEDEHAKALTEEELRALPDHTPEEWRLFVEFLAHTGLRIGEAVAPKGVKTQIRLSKRGIRA